MNKILKSFTVITLCVVIWGCNESKSQNAADTVKVITEDRSNNDVEELVDSMSFREEKFPPKIQALLDAYPENIIAFDDNKIILTSGDKIVFDDGLSKDFIGRLDNCDIEDMFYEAYALPDPVPDYQFDPGRSRSEALFKAMYGNSANAVQKKLVPVDWFGQKVQFTSVNGAADSLKAVAKEISLYPELRPYLKSSGTFYWRPVRGAKRMSAHSYGIAFDIGVDKSDYWQWRSGSKDENKKIKYSNRIPLQIVEIFQKHGFIWGGAWYHFDTMHFEFRPELLIYAELINSQAKPD